MEKTCIVEDHSAKVLWTLFMPFNQPHHEGKYLFASSPFPLGRFHFHLILHISYFEDKMSLYFELDDDFRSEDFMLCYTFKLKFDIHEIVMAGTPQRMFHAFKDKTEGYTNFMTCDHFVKLLDVGKGSAQFIGTVYGVFKDSKISWSNTYFECDMTSGTRNFWKDMRKYIAEKGKTKADLIIYRTALEFDKLNSFKALIDQPLEIIEMEIFQEFMYEGKLSIETLSKIDFSRFVMILERLHLVYFTLFHPIRTHVVSSVSFSTRSVLWKIPDFRSCSTNLKGPIFTDAKNCKWQILLENSEDSSSVSIFLQKLENISLDFVTGKIEFRKDVTDEKFMAHTFKCKVSSENTKVGVSDIKKETVFQNLQGDDLFLFGSVSLALYPFMTIHELFTCLSKESASSKYSFPIRLINLLKSGNGSDLSISAGPVNFKVHRAILYARSPVFAELLKKNNQPKLKLSGLHSSTLEAILYHIYTGQFLQTCSHLNFELYVAAEKYALKDLTIFCRNKLICELENDNICKVLMLAYIYQDSELSTAASEYMKSVFNVVFESDEWKLLLKQHLPEVLKIKQAFL